MELILPTAYLGPISYYQSLLNHECEIEQWESFEKQTLRNRCEIAGVNGRQVLTIPVKKVDHKQYTKDVEISYQQRWQHIHIEAMKSAYRNSPFYDYLIDEFMPFYERETKYLIDLNDGLNEVVLKILNNNKKIFRTTDFKRTILADFGLSNFNYLPYYQIWGEQKNLSVVDLLFNMGNEAIMYL